MRVTLRRHSLVAVLSSPFSTPSLPSTLYAVAVSSQVLECFSAKNRGFQAVDLVLADEVGCEGSWLLGDLVYVQRCRTPSTFHWQLFHINSKGVAWLFIVYPATVGNVSKGAVFSAPSSRVCNGIDAE